MTKKKKDDKKPSSAPAPVQPRDENKPAAAAPDTPPEAAAPDTPPEAAALDTPPEAAALDTPPEDVDPTVELMKLAFEAWVGKQLEGVMYYMTRTFSHHRNKEAYGTHLVFDALEQLNRGKHGEFIDQILAYRETLFAELDQYVAERNSKR
jgi:hypothetical protein